MNFETLGTMHAEYLKRILDVLCKLAEKEDTTPQQKIDIGKIVDRIIDNIAKAYIVSEGIKESSSTHNKAIDQLSKLDKKEYDG